jgi:hypothetical protein
MILEAVRLVVDHERTGPDGVEDVEAPLQEDTLVLEREAELRTNPFRTREAIGERRLLPRCDQSFDPGQVVFGGRGVAGEDALPRVARGDAVLEKDVHRVPDLRRGEADGARDGSTSVGRPETHDSLRVEPVRAAVEESERAVGESPQDVRGGRGHGGKRRELRRMACRASLDRREELEL